MKRIDILKEAHKLLRDRRECGICIAILRVSRSIPLKDVYIKDPLDLFFSYFTFENAKRFGASRNFDGYWWPIKSYGLFSGRRRFMRWLMKQYKNDKEEII